MTQSVTSLNLTLSRAKPVEFSRYKRSLVNDSSKVIFDDNIEEFVLKYSKNPELIKDYLSQFRKVGFAQSIKQYSQLDEQIQRFEGKNHEYHGWMKSFKQARDKMLSEVSTWNLQPLTYRGNDDIVNAIPKQNSHSGFNYLLTGDKTKGEYLEVEPYNKYMHSEGEARINKSFLKPIMIGTRTQGSFSGLGNSMKVKHKTRLVSMVDINLILAETKFAKPYQERMSYTSYYAGGKSDNTIHAYMRKWNNKYLNWYSLDYSKFDQSISDWLINEAFNIVYHSFKKGSVDNELFNIIRSDFITKAFIDGEGQLRFSTKGVPSGSMFTQIIDTIVNRLMILSYMNDYKVDGDMMIMGDDNIIFSNENFNLELCSAYLMRNFGVEMNPDKVSFGTKHDDPEFLSRTWKAGGGWRDLPTIVSKLCYPERFRNYNSGDTEVKLVFHSYILAYNSAMREFFNTEMFYDDYPELQQAVLSKLDAKHLSGNLRYRLEYTNAIG